MTRIVVIGHTGQVATQLRRQPLPKGWLLVALGRDRLDLSQPDEFKRVLETHEPDLVINAAAYTAVDRAEAEEELATLVNGRAPGKLAGVAAGFGIPLVHISTDYVFDGTAHRPWCEGDQPNPMNAYGRSKLAGERAVLESPARAVVLRTSWVFSPHGANFVKTMLRLGAERDELSIVADQYGGPTAADDIAAALMKIAAHLVETPAAAGLGIYHYAGAPATNWAEFAGAIFERADWLAARPAVKQITTAEYPTPARRPLNSVLDCSRIARDYGIAQPDWRAALSRTLTRLRSDNTRKRAT